MPVGAVGSEAQDGLRHDVALDLIGTAIDRDLAPVEIGRGRLRGEIRADWRLVAAVLMVVIGQHIGADDIHQQLRRRLLQLAALQLQDGAGRVRLAALAMALIGDDAELGHLQRLQADLDLRQLLAEVRLFQQRTVADPLQRRQLLDAAHPRLADAHAGDAANRADAANSLAVSADGKTTALHGTVANLDQYSEVRALAIPFVAGHTVLGPKAKESLDAVASSLASQKGYIVEVQGYSRAGVVNSQAMADSVVRYLVTAHQVPIYRIYRTGLGKQAAKGESAHETLANGVRVTVLQNSLATLNPSTTGSSN